MTGFPAYLADLCPAVERTLERLLPAANLEPVRLHSAMRYSIFAGGKRVRPALVVLAGEIHGAPRESLLGPAAAMELIHTFSLVHDDLPALDDDDLRRGRPTVHRQFDEALAILAGDALLNHALACLAREPLSAPGEVRARAVVITGEAVGSLGMIGGQVADLEAEHRWPDHPEQALESIHRRKTGSLLVASLLLGGIHADAGEGELDLLRRLGEALGLLFQIGDDLLDVEGSAATLGKAAGKDAAARKLTYPGLYGVEESRRRLDLVAEEARELAAALPRSQDTVRSLIRYLGERES
ncbi:MAG TPA: farnesyl diphosphate synthase [Thermoanaerobaculia bacterium]|nr:farnesyl diphosphate synthase [Thermoanaerobaculia bacterium]